MEGPHVELVDGVHRVQGAALADDAHGAAVGVAGESAGILDERLQAFVLLHFIVHGSLDAAGDADQTVVGLDDDHIVVSQTHVAGGLAVEDVVIDVDGRYEAVVAVDLDVTQRTDVVDAARHVEGVEHGGKG